MHPAVGFPLERYIPESGAEICGHKLPAGTNVSTSAPLIHMNKDVFGNDAEAFRPERWLEASPEQLRLMENSFIAVCSSFLAHGGTNHLHFYVTVWTRVQNLHWEEHIYNGDGQIHPSAVPSF